ncbi:alanine racemase [Parasphingorhabdus litoris]|uniref:alanine racemase n=1 Tax=Parasphingorhabdus litoris TaxID=394733 RepID=A0ABN1ARI7_9SPHN|nr:alanine racemase [Parasphingorhabdus litoris]
MSDRTIEIPPTAKLRLDSEALVSNWRVLDDLSGAASAGAAIKANAYGLGAVQVFRRLQSAGCQDFYVANWQEAAEIQAYTDESTNISVLNGVRPEDMPFAVTSSAKPVLNSIEQAKRWLPTGRPCDVMINSGMNRLGINTSDLIDFVWHEMDIDIVMSHLASADEDVSQNANQLDQFKNALRHVSGKRQSLSNSAGIALGQAYHFDCTRPGLSLYGGKQRSEFDGIIRQVVFPEAQILQTRNLKKGDKLGYNAKYVAERSHTIAILAMGYADGYLRGFSNTGAFYIDDTRLSVLGRVSMDLIAIDISDAPQLAESDWVKAQFDLPTASLQSGIAQYELITGMGNRFIRYWT